MARFSSWARSSGIPRDIRLITKQHIQAFFHYLLAARVAAGAERQLQGIERYRWPYYRALRRFFSWATKEGSIERSPMDGIALKAPKDPPVDPYHPQHIESMLTVLDSEWQTATTTRQRMLAARDRAIFLLFLAKSSPIDSVSKTNLNYVQNVASNNGNYPLTFRWFRIYWSHG